jgi:hypothetical protein
MKREREWGRDTAVTERPWIGDPGRVEVALRPVEVVDRSLSLHWQADNNYISRTKSFLMIFKPSYMMLCDSCFLRVTLDSLRVMDPHG